MPPMLLLPLARSPEQFLQDHKKPKVAMDLSETRSLAV